MSDYGHVETEFTFTNLVYRNKLSTFLCNACHNLCSSNTYNMFTYGNKNVLLRKKLKISVFADTLMKI